MSEVEFQKCEVLNIKIFLIALLITIFGFITFASIFKYQKYYNNKAIIYRDNNEFYLKLYVDIEDVEDIVKNDTINIDGEEYKYHIYYINKDLYVNESYNNYQEIMLKTNIKYPIENRVINITIKTKKERLIKFIFDTIKGGASKIAIAAGIIAGIVFIFGAIDGYIRPLRCH